MELAVQGRRRSIAADNGEPSGNDDNASIAISGAREHNLRNLDLGIPRDQFVVVTGVSGSGKSTLAFDILFSEGQRRFLDCMNAYARQFVHQLARPNVDRIIGIPPTVSIDQRNSRGGGKSTVATVTEVYHFLRLLFARLGIQHCPECQLPVVPQTRDAVVRQIRGELARRHSLRLLAPIIKNRKGFHTEVAYWALSHGYNEVRADGKLYSSRTPYRLDRFKEHQVEIVVARLDASRGRPARPLRGLVEAALDLGQGTVLALDSKGKITVHSTERTCPGCRRSFEALDPKHFSYHSPQGWCPRCHGFGEIFDLPDVDRGARADEIEESWFEWREGRRESCPECGGSRLNAVARAVRLPWSAPPRPEQRAVGRRRSLLREWALFRPKVWPAIDAFARAGVEEAHAYFSRLVLEGREGEIARDILPEIRERLRFLREVGLGYLQLGRGQTTLSGGESQRIRLAAQLGSNLSGVLYILDEPTIGLHARDNEQLLEALAWLRQRGNSLLVVEHDEATMRRADFIIDLGPGAGIEGGQVVATGRLPELLESESSITGQCLRQDRTFPSRGERRGVSEKPAGSRRGRAVPASKNAGPAWLRLEDCRLHNLKDLSVSFPLNRLIVVTGVSGSGKSTLVRECLMPLLEAGLNRPGKRPRGSAAAPVLGRLEGFGGLRGVYSVDQSPIGRTPRSIPATYVGFFNNIRGLFSQLPEARLRGYSPGRFSFNSPQGRCPVCTGAGEVKLEMNFLPPAYVRCEGCQGARFNPETLDILWNGKNIAQVLDLSVSEAIEFFAAIPQVRRPLEALKDTGLGYLKLGQTSPTLSGGEAQRVKLVSHLISGLPRSVQRLSRPETKGNLFILEEPTIGLHMADVRRLVEVLQRLVDAGHTVIVIEHNLDLIAEADWVIDLGPEAGEGGGEVVATGPPEAIARHRVSHTGRFLRPLLKGR